MLRALLLKFADGLDELDRLEYCHLTRQLAFVNAPTISESMLAVAWAPTAANGNFPFGALPAGDPEHLYDMCPHERPYLLAAFSSARPPQPANLPRLPCADVLSARALR